MSKYFISEAQNKIKDLYFFPRRFSEELTQLLIKKGIISKSEINTIMGNLVKEIKNLRKT